jgi:hypothetical protein
VDRKHVTRRTVGVCGYTCVSLEQAHCLHVGAKDAAGVLMEILADCACEKELRELQDIADRLFEALGACVPSAPGSPELDPLNLLSMPQPYTGNPPPVPTEYETIPETSPPLPIRTARAEWTEEDDAHLLALFDEHGTRWRQIARASPRCRSDDAVRNRVTRLRLKGLFKEAGRPQTPESAKTCVRSRGATLEGARVAWTSNEDELLRALVRTTRGWSAIAKSFKGRTPHACRNRVFRLSGTFV